jgi:hypothetical protein
LSDETEPAEDAPAGPAASREPFLLATALLALACAVLVAFGASHKWTSPTLAVLYALGGVESLIAVVLAVLVALEPRKRLALFVPGASCAALAAGFLTGVLLLSGRI